MINAADVPAEQLRFTLRMIRDEALARGWKVWLYYVGISHIRVQRKDGKILELYSATPPTTTFAAAHRANDKYFTHVVLEEAGLPVPETYRARDLIETQAAAQKFVDAGKHFVIKPIDAGHGHGVTVDMHSTDKVERAYNYAVQFSKQLVIQEHVTRPTDIRVACINFKYVAALVRVPARVKGDGHHTVRELIEAENVGGRRGENYEKELNVINVEQASLYMESAINDVPADGEWVQVLGTANVGTGGETIDVTDDVPQWIIDMSEKTAKIMDLASCGVDFLVNDMPKPSDTIEKLKPVIIEINKCPALFLHEKPTFGKPRATTAAYLDYLETL